MPVKQHVQEIWRSRGGRRRDLPRPLRLCCVGARGPGTLNSGPCSGWSPEGMDVCILPVLYRIQIPTRALISYVAGHGEWNHLLGLDSGLAAVSSVVVTEGSVVDRITVVVSHEWLTSFDAVEQFRLWIPFQSHGTDDTFDFVRVPPMFYQDIFYCHVSREDHHVVVTLSAHQLTLLTYAVSSLA